MKDRKMNTRIKRMLDKKLSSSFLSSIFLSSLHFPVLFLFFRVFRVFRGFPSLWFRVSVSGFSLSSKPHLARGMKSARDPAILGFSANAADSSINPPAARVFSEDAATRSSNGMATLQARLAQGDQAAFAELYDAYAARIGHYLLVRLGSRDDADDVLQETFLRLHPRSAARWRRWTTWRPT